MVDALDDPLIISRKDQTPEGNNTRGSSHDVDERPEAAWTTTTTVINDGMAGSTTTTTKSWQLIQCLLLFLSRVFDAQQCFITTFTDSSSTESNIISDWSLEDASPLLTSLPASAFFVGCIVGCFVVTPLSDSRLGRKNLLLLSCLLMSLTSLLIVLSPNIFLYSALRFVSGFGRASIGTCALVLSTEIVGPRWRSHVGIIGFASFSLGFASLPAIAYVNRYSWRHVYLWTSLPALLYCVVGCVFLKESPRWAQLEKSSSTASGTGGTYSAMRALVSKKWVLRRLVLVMVLAFGFGMAYYGMPLGLGSLSVNLYVSVAMEALIELPSAVAAFCLVGTVNRRSSILVITAVSGICSIACGVVTGSSWAQLALELAAFLVGSTEADIGMIYISELFPTSVRNSAVAMAWQANVLGGGAGAVLAAVGESRDNELITYGGFGVVIMVCGVFVMWLPETRGTEPCDTMEEEEWKQIKTSPGPGFHLVS